MSTTRIVCAGFGGQGIMTLGKILAMLGAACGKKVTWMPSYGAEVRGGTAHSMVIISDDDIPSPVINEADICVVMNKPSFEKFQSRVAKNGMIVLNSSLVEDKAKIKGIKVVKIAATKIASSLGSLKVANIVVLGALVSKAKLAPCDTALSLLNEFFGTKQELLKLNTNAFKEGIKQAV